MTNYIFICILQRPLCNGNSTKLANNTKDQLKKAMKKITIGPTVSLTKTAIKNKNNTKKTLDFQLRLLSNI